MGKRWKQATCAFFWAIWLLVPSVNATNVTLAWDPSPDAGASGVAGYKLYYSLQDFTVAPPIGSSILSIALGSTTSVTVGSLRGGLTYYFSVVSIDENGVESDFSEVAAYTVPFDTGGTGETGETPAPSAPTEINLVGILPRLWLQPAYGQMFLSVQGPLGATVAIQSSSNPADHDSWRTIANIKLWALATNANPAPASTLERAFIPGMVTLEDPNPPDGTFRAYRIYMPLAYPILASQLLNRQGYHSRLYTVRFPGVADYIVCYVAQEGAYLDYNQANHTVRLRSCGPTIREIADKVASTLGQNWTSASEFGVAPEGERFLLETILPIVDPLPDPLPDVPLPEVPLDVPDVLPDDTLIDL